MKRPRLLFVHTTGASFIKLDRDLLAERHEVVDWHPARKLGNPLRLVRELRRADAVVSWWATWESLLPLVFARLMRKPSLLIVGGFDVADVPEIGYGYQQGGIRKRLAHFVIAQATRVMTNSHYSREEIERNMGIPPERVEVVHHGVPDLFAEDGPREKEPLAVTVGVVARSNLRRKGHLPFVQAARELPDVRFVLAGKWADAAADELRAQSGDNVELTGFLSDEDLHDLLLRARVYVQPSAHEGFGISVAEAMLARCVPVVTPAGALPEVIGDTGVTVRSAEGADVAAGIREALELPDEAGERARDRVLTVFPLEVRREGLNRVVAELLRGS
jgi:glycosyltransferase involved in cell wall biosynthesis